MDEVLWAGEHRIDSASQRILRALRGGEWVYGGDLRKAADLSENTQVFYRMENYLKPSGLVVEAARAEEREARQFRLTEDGAGWVEEHAEEILAPATREEIAELAHEGYKAGTSAKESVQNYRKKVNRVKNRLDETRKEVGEIEDQQESHTTTLDVLWQRSEDNRDRSKDNRERLKSISEEVESRAMGERVVEVEEDLRQAEERVTTLEGRAAGVERQQAERERERAEIASLAKTGGYVAGGAAGAYVVLVGAVYLVAPGLTASAVIAGIATMLGIAVAIGGLLYVRGRRSLTVIDSEGEAQASAE